MACKFSCFLCFSDSLKENYVGVFESEDGDRYRVTYKSNVCRDLLLKIEWTTPKHVLVTVKLHNSTFKRCFSAKGIVVNGKKTFMKLRGAFNISHFRDYKVLCVINLIPYIKFECKEFLSESLDSGFLQLSSQSLLMNESNSVIDVKTQCVSENTEESSDVTNNSAMTVCEINIQDECYTSQTVIDNEYQECLPCENDFVLDEKVLTDDIQKGEFQGVPSKTSDNIEDEISSLLRKKDTLSAYDQSDETLRNGCIYKSPEGLLKSEQILDNEKNGLEPKFMEVEEVKLINESEMTVHETVLSNGTPNEMSTVAENKSQGVFEKENMLILDDINKEVMRNMDTNIDKDLYSKNNFSENNPVMLVHIEELSSQNPSVLHDEENLLGNADSKTDKEFSSNDLAPKANREIKFELNTSVENEGNQYSHDADEKVINTTDMEVNFTLESNDFSLKNNSTLEKDSSFSNYNICTYTQKPNSLKIHDNDAQPPIIKSKSQPINIQRISEAVEVSENYNRAIDNHESASPELTPSKTGLVFQTLVRKLSVDDCDLELPDVSGEVASSLGSQESNFANEKIFPIMESELKGLSMDMLDLLTSGDMVDAVITNGEKHIRVHRAIVSARSSILKEVFTKQSQDDVAYRAVVDIPSYILEDIIIFLYVGLIHIKSESIARDVYQVAERYCINDLIDICSKHVSK